MRIPVLNLCCVMLLLGAFAREVRAQNAQSISLFSAKAARSAESQYNRNNRQVRGSYQGSSSYSVAEQLQLETAEGVLLDKERQSDIYATYKAAAYLSYVRGFVDVGEFLEYEEEDAAKKVLLLEGLRLSNEKIVQPLFGEYYQKILKRLRALRDMTTLSVVQNPGGDFDVSQGEFANKSLLQFRIHASARNGLEPRVRIADTVEMRVQLLEEKLLFEYSYSF